MARVRVVLGRSSAQDPPEPVLIRIEKVKLDPERRLFRRGAEEIHPIPKEFALLALMMKNAGVPVTHVELLRSVWGSEYGGEVEYLRTYVRTLRKKIEKIPAKPEYIVKNAAILRLDYPDQHRHRIDRMLRQIPCYDLQRLRNLLAAPALAAPFYIVIANETSLRSMWTQGPRHRGPSGRTIDRPYQPDRRLTGSDAEESEIEAPGVGNRRRELSMHMRRHHKSLKQRDIRLLPEVGTRVP